MSNPPTPWKPSLFDTLCFAEQQNIFRRESYLKAIEHEVAQLRQNLIYREAERALYHREHRLTPSYDGDLAKCQVLGWLDKEWKLTERGQQKLADLNYMVSFHVKTEKE